MIDLKGLIPMIETGGELRDFLKSFSSDIKIVIETKSNHLLSQTGYKIQNIARIEHVRIHPNNSLCFCNPWSEDFSSNHRFEYALKIVLE